MTVTKLRKSFSNKEVQSLDDYLGVRIIRNKDHCKACLGQPTILTSLEKKFGEDVTKLRTTQTPGTPEYEGTKAQDKPSVVSP